jgi:putative two-component system response regulator
MACCVQKNNRQNSKKNPTMTTRTATVLIVDDQVSNLKLFEVLIKAEGHLTQTASNGETALAMVAKQPPDLILLDVMMPGMDGYQVAATLKADPATRNIPIIMVTSLDDHGARLSGLNAGVEEFLTKPVDSAELWVRVRNMLRMKEYNDLLDNHNRILEHKVKERTQELHDSYIEAIFTMTLAAEYKDEDTGVHVRRISYYSKYLAEALGMDGAFIENIFYASPMHDIGKLGISDAILLKPGRHTPAEFEIMKTHSALGAKILAGTRSPYLQMGAEIALGHHERFNGGGYPNGAKGEAIPISARIMSICDVYDALRSKRRYKPAFDHAKSVAIITEGDGRTQPEHFDPDVLAAFKRGAETLREIYGQHTD